MITAASIEKLQSGSKQLKKIAKSAKKEKRAYIDALRCPSREDVKNTIYFYYKHKIIRT
jgi:hypothetical protein